MTSTTKASSALARRYAASLIELAGESKTLQKVEADLRDLGAMVEGSDDLKLMIRSPLIGKIRQEISVSEIAKKAKFQDITKNFLCVLAHNGRLNILTDVIEAFYEELDMRRGKVRVDVQVAQDMSAAQKKSLQKTIADKVGAEVELNLRVEPGILGGMIVTVGSHMIDDSVARKLERLQTAMNKRSNENLADVKEA